MEERGEDPPGLCQFITPDKVHLGADKDVKQETLSLGWTRITNSFLTLSPLKMSPGTSLYWIRTSAFLSFKALPHFRMNGTPSHLSLLILRTADAKVGHVEPSGTVGSWRYPRRPSSSEWSGSHSY